MKPYFSPPRRPRPAVVAAAALVVLACIGAATESPAARPAIEPSAPATQQIESPVWQTASHPQKENISSRDLKLPRAPRHRSERPTSGLEELQGTAADQLLAVLADEHHGALVIAAPDACPLAGHPLSLLRPPSLLAG